MIIIVLTSKKTAAIRGRCILLLDSCAAYSPCGASGDYFTDFTEYCMHVQTFPRKNPHMFPCKLQVHCCYGLITENHVYPPRVIFFIQFFSKLLFHMFFIV